MPTLAAVAVLAIGLPSAVIAQSSGAGGEGQEASAAESLGTVRFPITCSAAAQERFEAAAALLHHMMYREARAAFEGVAREDPNCAMAHWGIAMTLFQPLWPSRPSEADLARGLVEVEMAASAGLGTGRERAFVEATRAFVDPSGQPDYLTRLDRFERAMQTAYEAYPDDPEVATFYALAHLGTVAKSDRTFAHQETAAAILAKVVEAVPDHPGAIHYTIHIYVRLGEWEEVIDWNRRSAAAALERPAGPFTSSHYLHALDYLIYAYLQRAEDEEAAALLAEQREPRDYEPIFSSAYALAAMPARYVLERREWGLAAALTPRQPANFPWDRYPQTEALTHYARALGAAREGDGGAAREAVTTLRKLRERSAETGEPYWARQIDLTLLVVEAWIAWAEGRESDALLAMASAVELEESAQKDPVTPGAIQPAAEQLGDLFLEMGEPGQALEAYERSLGASPGRFNSLLGAARAAAEAGQPEKADAYYRALLEQTEESAGDREGVAEARRALSGGS